MQSIFLNDVLIFDLTVAECLYFISYLSALFTILLFSTISYLYLRYVSYKLMIHAFNLLSDQSYHLSSIAGFVIAVSGSLIPLGIVLIAPSVNNTTALMMKEITISIFYPGKKVLIPLVQRFLKLSLSMGFVNLAT